MIAGGISGEDHARPVSGRDFVQTEEKPEEKLSELVFRRGFAVKGAFDNHNER